jgi:hypothetical protein
MPYFLFDHAERLEANQVGDIAEVDRLGRRCHALVAGHASGRLSIQPLDRRISYRSCRADDVVAHWAKRGRPRPTDGHARALAAAARGGHDDPQLTGQLRTDRR